MSLSVAVVAAPVQPASQAQSMAPAPAGIGAVVDTASQFLANNPAVVAALIGSMAAVAVGLLTFFGVLLSLRSATKRTRLELEHSARMNARDRDHTREQAAREREHAADQAHVERIATARRLVYLEAVAELVKAQAFIGSLPKFDLANMDIGAGLQGFYSAIAKVTVIGDQATAMQARSIANDVNLLVLRGLQRLAPLAGYKAELAVHVTQYDLAQSEIQRVIAAMTAHNEARSADQDKFEALQRSFEGQQELASSFADKAAAKRRQIAAVTVEYGMAATDQMLAIGLKLDELAVAIRGELGLATDPAALRQQTQVVQGEIRAALHSLAAGVAADLAAKPGP